MSHLLLLSLVLGQAGPKEELLWPKGAPGAVGAEAADKPSLTVWLPPAGQAFPPPVSLARLEVAENGRRMTCETQRLLIPNS